MRLESCELLGAGNQEDAFATVADTKATMVGATLKSVEGESGDDNDDEDGDGGAKGVALEWLKSDVALLEDDEQQLQQQQQNGAPTALEALLDLELDVYNLPALEDNQFALQEQQSDEFGALSLELLVSKMLQRRRIRGNCERSNAVLSHAM